MNVTMTDGNLYAALMCVKNASIIWINISLSAVNAGFRLAIGAEGIGCDSINSLKGYDIGVIMGVSNPID